MSGSAVLHRKAVRLLAATTVFWSLSFPLVKSLNFLQGALLPQNSSWFHASLISVFRFGVAAVVLLLVCRTSIGKLTPSEIWQGAGLGFFAAGGILLQADGLSYTSASASAFLTQGFCVIVPLVIAFRTRSTPGFRVIAALLMMLAGVAILSNFDLRTFHLGRGEAETLVAAFFFAGQILWLDRPLFTGNNANHYSFVMFLTMALLSFPVLVITWHSPRDILVCLGSPWVWLLLGAITLFCTLIAFVYMNKWQPFVTATEAAIIYGAEPVFASVFALFLPGLISKGAGINYPNEIITWQLAAGGLLILGANLVLQLKRGKNRTG